MYKKVVNLLTNNENLTLVLKYLGTLAICAVGAELMINAWTNYTGLTHSVLELVCVLVAVVTFLTVWYSYEGNSTGIHIIAFGFLAVALFDGLHTYYFSSLNFYPKGYIDLASRFWVIGRLTEAVVLLLGGAWVSKLKINKWVGLVVTLAIGLGISSVLIYFPSIMPNLLTESQSVTGAKVIFEYFIILLFTVGLVIGNKRLKRKASIEYKYIVLALLIAIPRELSLSLYYNFASFYMNVGHLLKLAFYYFIFRGVFVGSIKHIYERSQKAINDSEEWFRRAFDYVHTGVAIAELDGNWVRVNDSLSEMIGYSKEELLEMNFTHITHPDDLDENFQYFQDMLDEKIKSFGMDKRYIKKSGEIIWVRVNVTLVRNGEDKPLYFVSQIEDISEHKMAQELQKRVEENVRQLREAREIDKLKTEFFANLSHEFKTPLNVILSSLQLLDLYNKNGKTVEPSVLNKHSKIMKQNSRRLLRLVNNLIDSTKIDSGHFEVALQNYDIIRLVEDVTLSVADYIKSKGINITFDTNIEEKIIACDPYAIERIILNLLSNATKFTKQGGSIFVSLRDEEENIVLSVKDTGIGIAKDKQRMIFERFIQVDKSLTRNHEGSGIGLSLVKTLVEMHGGEVSVESEYRKGCEFIIRFPVKVLEESEGARDSIGYYEKDHYLEKVNIEFSDIYMIS